MLSTIDEMIPIYSVSTTFSLFKAVIIFDNLKENLSNFMSNSYSIPFTLAEDY